MAFPELGEGDSAPEGASQASSDETIAPPPNPEEGKLEKGDRSKNATLATPTDSASTQTSSDGAGNPTSREKDLKAPYRDYASKKEAGEWIRDPSSPESDWTAIDEAVACATDTRMIILASRLDPLPEARAVAARLNAKPVKRRLLPLDHLGTEANPFENSEFSRLLVEYQQANVRFGPHVAIIETASEENLSSGIAILLKNTPKEFLEKIKELGIFIIVALRLRKMRVAHWRESDKTFEIPWSARWLEAFGHSADATRHELTPIEDLLDRHLADHTAQSDERGYRIFMALDGFISDAAEPSDTRPIEDLVKDIQARIEQAVEPSSTPLARSREHIRSLLRTPHGEAGDPIVRAMLYIGAFCGDLVISDFRTLCEHLLPAGPIEHLDQLPHGSLHTSLVEARMNGEHPALPDWKTVFDRTFDDRIAHVGLRITGGRVVFGRDLAVLQDEILSNHAGLVSDALKGLIEKDSFHELDRGLAQRLMESFARCHEVLDERVLADALAKIAPKFSTQEIRAAEQLTELSNNIEGLLEALPETQENEEIILASKLLLRKVNYDEQRLKGTITSREVIRMTARLGDLLGVFLRTTATSDNENHVFWRLLRRMDRISQGPIHLILSGAYLRGLSWSSPKSAPLLARAVVDCLRRTDEPERTALLPLIRAATRKTFSEAIGNPHLWMYGFQSLLPMQRTRKDMAPGLAVHVLEDIFENEVPWGPHDYVLDEILAPFVFPSRPDSEIDPTGACILQCLFGTPPRSWLLAQSWLLEWCDDTEASDRLYDLIFRRLRDVTWVLLGGANAGSFPSLKVPMKTENLLTRALYILTQECTNQGVDSFPEAVTQIIRAAGNDGVLSSADLRLAGFLDLYALFPASIFLHWRFMAFGIAPLDSGTDAARSLGTALDYLAAMRPSPIQSLARSLRILEKASRDLSAGAAAAQAPEAAKTYQQKTNSIGQLAVAAEARAARL